MSENQVKYPQVEVALIGEDSNAMVIVATVSRALKRAGISNEEANAFRTEALSGDYNKVLQTAQAWVTVY